MKITAASHLGIGLIPGHTDGMEMPKIAVHFACRHCEKIYVASQENQRGTGTFNCLDCGKQVHQWSGFYSFTNWKPVQS